MASAFEIVSENLKDLGALTLEEFFSDDHLHTDVSYPLPDFSSALEGPSNSVSTSGTDIKKLVDQTAISRLHQTCQRIYGCSLKFEFLEGRGHATKQCILSITRPNGASRCYKTEPIFSKKIEAKAHVATLAINMGAIEFIMTGDVKPRGRASHTSSDDAATHITQIHDACLARGDEIKPCWYALRDPKYGSNHGCALKVQLSLHSFRVYCSDTTFDTFDAAKLECARAAVSQGVLDYIKNETAVYSTQNGAFSSKVPDVISLQTFYDSLPRPFPENFEDKTAAEINAPGYLNGIVQAARGSKFTLTFIPFSAPGGYHGSVLKLERPNETKCYLVDPRFTKRADAKAAVCFQAFSEGICSYIRSVGDATEMKISEAMRKLACNRILPSLTNEHSKKRPNVPLDYQYYQDKDAFGCSLTLALRERPRPSDTRAYSVPAEYRTKNDAKLALLCVVAAQGGIEFLRFSGRPIPSNYTPFIGNDATQALAGQRFGKKRKESDVSEESIPPAKRQKQDVDSERSSTADTQGSSSLSNRPGTWDKPDSWKRKYSELADDDQHAGRSQGPWHHKNAERVSPPSSQADHSRDSRFWASNPEYSSGSPSDQRLGYGGGSQRPYHSAPYSMFESSSRKDDLYSRYPERLNSSHSYDDYETRRGSFSHNGNDLYPQTHSSSRSYSPQSLTKEPRNWSLSHMVPSSHSDARVPSTSSSFYGTVSPLQSQHRRTHNDGVSKWRRANHDDSSAKHFDRNQSPDTPDYELALLAYCRERQLSIPVFHEEVGENSQYKVWMVMGLERLELPVTYPTFWEARQRLSKKVLDRLRTIHS